MTSPSSRADRVAARVAFFDTLAPSRDDWKRRNAYYHDWVTRLCRSLIPEGASVLELGSGTGDLLAALRPNRGVGVDLSPAMVRLARAKHQECTFLVGDAERLPLREKFDFILMSDLVGDVDDLWVAFNQLHDLCTPRTRVVLTYYNFLWEPILKLADRMGLKTPQLQQNWLSPDDIRNLLILTDFAVVEQGTGLLLPKPLPGLTWLLNERLARAPAVRHLCLVHYYVARPAARQAPKAYTCSVIVPCRNEVANIESCVERIPSLGAHTEIVFVDGLSTDGTREKIEESVARYRGKKDIKLILQVPEEAYRALAVNSAECVTMLPLGKGDAVRKGFNAASGDILVILDADLTVPPEDLPKFYLP